MSGRHHFFRKGSPTRKQKGSSEETRLFFVATPLRLLAPPLLLLELPLLLLEPLLLLLTPRLLRVVPFCPAAGVKHSSVKPFVRAKGRKFEKARGRRPSRGYKN